MAKLSKLIEDKTTIIRLQMDNAEFHLLIEAMYCMRYFASKQEHEAIDCLESAHIIMNRLGEGRMDDFIDRINRIHNTICPDEESN